MHIAEGFLPAAHAAAWTAVAAPFVVSGARRLTRVAASSPQASLRLGASGGFTLLMSSLKLPSIAGSSSHPTGMALGTLACGPREMAAIGPIVLVLQALLLGHGGLSTLGANTVSMSVAGPWTTWAVWWCACRALPPRAAVMAGAAAGALATYVVTSAQLALAFPDPVSGVAGAFAKFAAMFLTVQTPLAIAEAVFTVYALDMVASRTDGAVARRA